MILPQKWGLKVKSFLIAYKDSHNDKIPILNFSATTTYLMVAEIRWLGI
jgi:hypothetical protein